MNNQTVWYRQHPIGNVQITLNPDGMTGKAVIDGKTRNVVYKPRPQGKLKGQMKWHCDD
jgi:hypothetical protein